MHPDQRAGAISLAATPHFRFSLSARPATDQPRQGSPAICRGCCRVWSLSAGHFTARFYRLPEYHARCRPCALRAAKAATGQGLRCFAACCCQLHQRIIFIDPVARDVALLGVDFTKRRQFTHNRQETWRIACGFSPASTRFQGATT